MLAHIEVPAVQRSLLLSAVIQLAPAGLGLFPVCFPAVFWLWTPDKSPLTPADTTMGWEVMSQTDFLQTTKMNYIALPLDKMRSECQISAMLLEPGSVLSCTSVASIFFYSFRLQIMTLLNLIWFSEFWLHFLIAGGEVLFLIIAAHFFGKWPELGGAFEHFSWCQTQQRCSIQTSHTRDKDGD